MPVPSSRLPGFFKKSVPERRTTVCDLAGLNEEERGAGREEVQEEQDNRQSKIFSFSLNENGDIIETNGVSDIVRIETIPDTSEESDNQHESLVFLSGSDSILERKKKCVDYKSYLIVYNLF